MKSALQARAEDARKRFNGARKPIVLEFAGVPKAGKTTTLGQIQTFLKRCGFRVEVVVERASVCPIRDKKHANFNIWTACTTLSKILEKTQTPAQADDPDVLILDRGLFDAVNWLAVMERLARIQPAERQVVESFLLLKDWSRRMTGVIVMTTSPHDSMERERGYLPVDTTGSIMNEDVLRLMLETTRQTVERLDRHFRIHQVDTSKRTSASPQETAEIVADITLSLIEEQIEEKILCLPAEVAASQFGDETCLTGSAAGDLATRFTGDGQFRSREEVEADDGVVQALPVVVVRNNSGDVLRLRRRERRSDDPLHEKIVIWAGGHVRLEDNANGASITQCAVRELNEELRLSVEAGDLALMGAVWIRNGNRTRLHVALVFEWRAPTDDVAVVLSATEFFERQGTSLSGRFVDVAQLARDVDVGGIHEPWSVEIVRRLLPDTAGRATLPLLV